MNYKHIHFIGIGGIGMSALARLFLEEGKRVSGSDRSISPLVEALREEGAEIFPLQVAGNITDDTDLVIYTEAMPKDHEELVAAKEKGILAMNYFEALGQVANEYYLIAVAGSHGKTTTTAMLIDILETAGLDPSGIVGSLRATTKSNYRRGKSKYFIAEACEYRRDFLSLTPDVLIITNIEHEHVDYYQDLASVQQAFREFAFQVRDGGAVIADCSQPSIAPVVDSLPCRVIDYGKQFDPLLRLRIPGVHNHMNAAAARAAALFVGVPDGKIREALGSFKGTWRRFEYKGEVNGAKVYDDYGHHPTEIRATIAGARELYPDKRLVVVFQPHTYSRTHVLFDEFVRALGLADHVVLLPIYAAREVNESGVSHAKLADALRGNGRSAEAFDTFDDALAKLRDLAHNDSIMLVMGAGNVTEIAARLTK